MKKLAAAFAPLAALLAAPLLAGPLAEVSAQIVILGEVHDNPAHHAVQAEAVADLTPAALVFEMLTPKQAARVLDVARDDAAALEAALDWQGSGWPDFAMYHPIFTAAPEAAVYGAAVPRDETRRAMQIGVSRTFGEGAEVYGLATEIDTEQLAERLNLQMDAHCGALPLNLLPGMVELQRLRDAELARAALTALEETGGPVAVITGNGHARMDWGVPSYIARVAPEVTVYALAQGEDGGVPNGGFDLVLDAPAVEREDPCAVFR
jgi:uncharacterized iron-regulated protein